MRTLQPRHAPNRAKGFSLIEMGITLGVLAVMLPLIASVVTARQREIREQVAAQQLKTVTDAASYYVKENFATLYSAAAAGTVAVPVASLVAAGKLPSSFQSKNGYGQTHCLLVKQAASASPLQIIEAFVVTEGGVAIPAGRLAYIAAMVGASGGSIDSVSGTTTIRGAFGGYQLAAAPYQTASCSGTATDVGHLASSLSFDDQNLLADFLYRNQVPGHPEANTMSTNINMGGNNLDNANRLIANTFVDKTNAAYSVTPSGTSTVNNLNVNGTLNAAQFCDVNDPSYCVDPAGISRIQDTYITNRSNTVRVSSLLPNYVDKGASVVSNGQFVVKPSCPDAGTPSIRISPAVFQPDTSLLSNIFAVDAGSSWRVMMTTSGGTLMPPGTQSLASFGCLYP